MAISFPGGSKSNGQKFTHQNKSWTWDGNSWKGGVSSGSDAGTLDSLNSTQFLRSDADDTVTGQITFPGNIGSRPVFSNGILARSDQTDTSGTHDIWGISERYYPSNPTAGDAWGIQWGGSPNEINFIGAGEKKFSVDLDTAGNIYMNTSGGNVGIGTTTPDNTLTVNGGTESIGVQISETARLTLGADGTWNYFKGKSGNGHYFNTTGGGLVVLNNAGNVGMGTSGPNESLHIYRSSGDASFRLQSASQQLRIDQNSIRTTTNSSIGIFTNGNTNQMYLNQSTGNVGIGTSSPNQKLDVSGVTRSHKMEIQSSSSDATFLNIINQAGGVDSRIDLKTSANNGGDPFIFFDAGGSNMVVGNHWSGTTNNQLRMGTGGSVSSSSFKGISIDGLGKIISGPAIHINEGRGGSNTFNITNSSEAYNLMMPSFYGAGSINETYRHAYTINTPFHTTLWQGGGGNTVFTTWSKIGAEHYRDIYVETYTLYYSDLRIKVVTDGNAGISVWYAGATYQNNVYSARWRVYPLQACTLTMNPSSSYSSFYHVHTASGGREESGTATAATGSGPSTW